MTLEEIKRLLEEAGEAVQGERKPGELIKLQSKLAKAIAIIDETYANQWLSAKQSGLKITDGYADMMAKSGTSGLREGVKAMFEVLNNLINLK